MVRTIDPGSKDPGFECRSYPTTLSQHVQLDWFIKGRVVCGLYVIHALKGPLGVGKLPGPWLPILTGVGSLGLNGAQPQWDAQHSISECRRVWLICDVVFPLTFVNTRICSYTLLWTNLRRCSILSEIHRVFNQCYTTRVVDYVELWRSAYETVSVVLL
jgi:hypothetical protein